MCDEVGDCAVTVVVVSLETLRLRGISSSNKYIYCWLSSM